MRERSFAPERVEAFDEFLGGGCPLAERDYVFFDLALPIAIEIGLAIVVGANRCVDRFGCLAKVAGLPLDVGAEAGDGNASDEEQASVHAPWTCEVGKALAARFHSVVIRFILSMIG
jgi:hypothetical protein